LVRSSPDRDSNLQLPDYKSTTQPLAHQPAMSELVTVIQHRTSRRIHPLNHQVIQYHLLLGSFYNVLLNTVLCHQPVHTHLYITSSVISVTVFQS